MQGGLFARLAPLCRFAVQETDLIFASFTAAQMCGLAALDTGSRVEGIVPAYTWIASASAVVAGVGMQGLAEAEGIGPWLTSAPA